jgi:predicted nucleic acid-binding protein
VIVVDASALVAILVRGEAWETVERRLFGSNDTIHAPHLVDVEVASALRRLVTAGKLESDRAGAAIEALADLRIARHAHRDLLPRVWPLRQNLSIQDAVYVALAEGLDAPLITRDRRLSAAPGHTARVEVV